MGTSMYVLLLLVGLVLGGGVGFYIRNIQKKEEEMKAEEEKKRVLRDADAKAKEILFEARNESLKIQEDAKKEERDKRMKLQQVEHRLVKKEDVLDQKMDSAEKLKEDLEGKVASVKQLKLDVQAIYEQQRGQLEEVAKLSKEEARELLLKKKKSPKMRLLSMLRNWKLLSRRKLMLRLSTLLPMLYRSTRRRLRLSRLRLLWLCLMMR